MKRSLLVVAFVSCLTLSAQAEYTDADRIEDMQKMEQAMVNIQKGILWNNPAILEEGVKTLKVTATGIKPPKKEVGALSAKNSYNAKYTIKQGKKIAQYADDIARYMEESHRRLAAKSYLNVMNQCIACHNKIREGK